MIDDDTQSVTPATRATPLDKSIERYHNALIKIESAVAGSKEPSFQEIVEALVARDVVEKKRLEDQNPSGESIAKLIGFDKRLKAQSKAIAKNKDLDEAKKFLSQDTWWWQLTDFEAVLSNAVEGYNKALSALEEAVQNPPPQPIRELIRDVLRSRDAVEQIRREEKQPPKEIIKEIMDLDERLWKQAGAIAKEVQVDKWKVDFTPPASNWWWQITTESPYFSQCVDRYKEALEDVKNTPNPDDIQTLKLLKSRDVLEKAIQNQQSMPEVVSKQIVELDQELKQQRLALTRGKKLLNWKKSLNPPSSNWWWNFKPTLFGDDEEPLPLRDRLWIIAAVACIGIAAGFVVNTTQTFQTSTGRDKNGDAVRSDAAQNSLVILQGGGLLALSASTVTKRGQKMVENLIDSIPFIRPNWQAPATFGLSLIALGVAYSINQSLPKFGDWYFFQGQRLEEENQLFQAQEKYLQAKKFFNDADDKVKLSLSLGKVYEQQGNVSEAIKEYRKALATDNAEVMNRLGRAILIGEMQKVGWTGKITDDALIREVKTYFYLVENKIKKRNSPGRNKNNRKNHDNQNKQLKKELQINKGILALAQFDLNKTDFKNTDESTKNSLVEIQKTFKEATKNEDELPTNLEGRKARCYLELATGLINLMDWKRNNFCSKILNYVNDINDANMMSQYIGFIDYKKQQQEKEKRQQREKERKANQLKQVIQQRVVKLNEN
jgi:tetratricopeptide (TPR) repeat protein